ncbi:MAG: XRE family transcriptional regulator [Rhodocyclaceae bacterium]|jgi:Zn-dependent peptidase ImmA (M78 family)/transcriptional regulator with XRE-family HTH domain|nr:XRE family transcriptional regulator [Rhodocyclaceae bacterium]HLS97572.1 XRE family transcriptional regulator [Porticoccaceae bacterium]
MFAERMHRARKAAGLSMDALAREVGVSANAIKKYEHGHAMPTSGNLLKLAKALNVRSEYFFRPIKVKLQGVEYRKRANAPRKVLDKINGDILDQAERWAELLDLYPDSIKPVPTFCLPADLAGQVPDMEAVDAIAEQLRESWELGLGPIPELIDVLEARGLMVIVTDVAEGRTFDGLAGTLGQTPVVVISSQAPGDRQRFTLAHELGHLVLAGRLLPDRDLEMACNRFAGAFLLPATTLRDHLGQRRHQFEARELYMLKHEFGVSMAAILIRALQCGIITESRYKQWQIHFSREGWRSHEPGEPCPRETTQLFRQLVYRALAEEYIGESKAAELLKMPLSLFHKERKLEGMDAVADQ